MGQPALVVIDFRCSCRYRYIAPKLHSIGLPLAQSFLVEGGVGGRLKLVMKDLRDQFPVPCGGSLSEIQIESALHWLAKLHCAFWGQATPECVWEQGQYWHLRTRLEELENMGACLIASLC